MVSWNNFDLVKPDKVGDYLVYVSFYNSNKSMLIASYVKHFDSDSYYWIFDDFVWACEVTHWMNLPEIPKE